MMCSSLYILIAEVFIAVAIFFYYTEKTAIEERKNGMLIKLQVTRR